MHFEQLLYKGLASSEALSCFYFLTNLVLLHYLIFSNHSIKALRHLRTDAVHNDRQLAFGKLSFTTSEQRFLPSCRKPSCT